MTTDSLKCLTVVRGASRFGIPMENFVEIRAFYSIRPLPRAENFFAGFVLFQGKVLPVLDLPPLVGLPPMRVPTPAMAAVIRLEGDPAFVIIVDRVEGGVDVPTNQLTELPCGAPGVFLGEWRSSPLSALQILAPQDLINSLEISTTHPTT